jgi:hypothetical protein
MEESMLRIWQQWKSMSLKQRLILVGMLLILFAAIALRMNGF